MCQEWGLKINPRLLILTIREFISHQGALPVCHCTGRLLWVRKGLLSSNWNIVMSKMHNVVGIYSTLNIYALGLVP